eukprot:613296-Prymnesium_polylepis.1
MQHAARLRVRLSNSSFSILPTATVPGPASCLLVLPCGPGRPHEQRNSQTKHCIASHASMLGIPVFSSVASRSVA